MPRFVAAGTAVAAVFVAAALGLVGVLSAAPQEDEAPPGDRPAERPNIVYVVVDDMDLASVEAMPVLRRTVVDEGLSMSRFFTSYPLCCPSRATVLRGQYAHNTGILGNSPPDGGFVGFHSSGKEESTVATWLQDAGYRTALMGKYLNNYPKGVGREHVPPGWTDWRASIGSRGTSGFGYLLNENGRPTRYGNTPEDYYTDVLSEAATDFVTDEADDPFFLYLGPHAPHVPATPAPRHQRLFADAAAPRSASFNESDVSDKPPWIRALPRVSPAGEAALDELHRIRIRSLQAVDEMVGAVVDALRESGRLEDTYVVFTSDNGYTFGSHRVGHGKNTMYEEDIRVPFFVRGPGIPAGRTIPHLSANLDLAPTFADIAGAPTADFVDGRSLLPLWQEETPAESDWRQAVLLEHQSRIGGRIREGDPVDGPPGPLAANPDGLAHHRDLGVGGHEGTTVESPAERADGPDRRPGGRRERPDPEGEAEGPVPRFNRPAIPTFQGVRTDRYVYVEYRTGERELYDLAADPNQLTNIAETADPALVDRLAAALEALAACEAEGCRTAEDEAAW